jgi:hypothetical protein
VPIGNPLTNRRLNRAVCKRQESEGLFLITKISQVAVGSHIRNFAKQLGDEEAIDWLTATVYCDCRTFLMTYPPIAGKPPPGASLRPKWMAE